MKKINILGKSYYVISETEMHDLKASLLIAQSRATDAIADINNYPQHLYCEAHWKAMMPVMNDIAEAQQWITASMQILEP